MPLINAVSRYSRQLIGAIHKINTLNSSVVYLKDLAVYFDEIYT